jgi:hypothetical protein
MDPYDYEEWMDGFASDIIGGSTQIIGGGSSDVEDQFIKNPNIENAAGDSNGVIDTGVLPGTDITVGAITDPNAFYEFMYAYQKKMYDNGLTSVTITKFTIYQMTNYDIATVRTSTPTNRYQWKVSGPGGTVEKTTTTPFAKLLFQTAGTYSVDIYNEQSVVRCNKVSGKKTELWVLSNGGYFDGLAVYENTRSFSGYIGENLPATLEQVRLVDDSFTANVSASMLNVIQVMDKNGNMITPSDSFTTQR